MGNNKILSSIEQKILQKLDKDVRTPVTQIAKYARTSQENATYHLQKLQKKGILIGYWGMPRFSKNTAAYKLFFKDKGIGDQKQALIDYLLSKKEVVWIAESHGTWDFTIAIITQTEHKATTTVTDILDQFGTSIGQRTLIKYVTVHSINEKYLHEDTDVRVQTDDFTYATTMDETDKKIQEELLKDARKNYSEIARTIDVSPETVRKRAKTILKTEILDLKPRINHQLIGLEYYHIMISIQDRSITEELLNTFKQHENCVFIGEHIGEYDVHLELVVQEDELSNITNLISERFGKHLRKYDVLHIHKEHTLKLSNEA